MLNARITVSAFFAILLMTISGYASAENQLGTMLVLPIIPDSNIDIDETEEVDELLAQALKKEGSFKVLTIDDLEKSKSRKRIRRLLQCGDDFKCISKRLRRDTIDLVMLGKAELYNGNRRKVSFVIFNLNDGETKRKKSQKYSEGKFKNRRAEKWAGRLLKEPSSLLSADEDDVKTEARPAKASQPEATAPIKETRKPKIKIPTEKEVKEGMKQAYKAYVEKDIDKAVVIIGEVYEKPCRCNADRDVLQLKAMLVEFKKLHDESVKSLKSYDTKATVEKLEQLKSLGANILEEGSKLGVAEISGYTKEINEMFASAYMAQAKYRLGKFKYLEARESLIKVLGYDPENKEAKQELDNMSTKYPNALYMRAAVTADADPKAAIIFLKQVLELTNPESEMYIKAQNKIKEIEEFEEY